MKKTVPILVMAIGALIALSVILNAGCCAPKAAMAPKDADVTYVESIQLDPPDDYIQQLEQIVEKNEDPYVRETAIFALTDIASRKGETDEIIDFLKDIGTSETDDNVRSAAYANIDLIRERFPPEKKGSLEVSLSGDVKKGATVILTATASATTDIEEAIIGIDRLHQNIDMVSAPFPKFSLVANEPKDLEFTLLLKETGEYTIPVTLFFSYDRFDYKEIQKEILLRVYDISGEVGYLED